MSSNKCQFHGKYGPRVFNDIQYPFIGLNPMVKFLWVMPNSAILSKAETQICGFQFPAVDATAGYIYTRWHVCTLSPNLSYLRRNVFTIPIVRISCFESLAIMEDRSRVLLSRVLVTPVLCLLCQRNVLGNECRSRWNGTSLIIGNFKMVIMRTPMSSFRFHRRPTITNTS